MPAARKPIDRRRFLTDVARAAAGCAVAGSLLGLYAREARALPAEALRPPGALPETEFLAACIRCGLCVRDCPYDTLSLADLVPDVAVPVNGYVPTPDAFSVTSTATDEWAGMLYASSCGVAVRPAPDTSKA